ncbi:MAG: hypothetical protein JW874_15870 [Spirochaetales bacterium]|nr:hypothetical protein [Spirochaetales bacterium]
MKLFRTLHPLLFFLAAVLFGCSPTVEPESDFTLISGSGHVTFELTGLVTAGYNGELVTYGVSDIPFGEPGRVGHYTYVDSDDMSLVLTDNGTDFLFYGGTELGFCGASVDSGTYVGLLDDGDYITEQRDITVGGDITETFDWPDDFVEVENSGHIDLRFTGLNTVHPGTTLIYGVSGIQAGGYERFGGIAAVDSDDMAIQFIDNDLGGYHLLFTGGTMVGAVGAVVDLNGNYIPEDGEFIALVQDIAVDSGDQEILMAWPGDFEEISGCGSLTITVNGLSEHIGEDLLYGVAGIEFGGAERLGGTVEIDADTMSMTIQYDSGGGPEDYPFLGGQGVDRAGAVVDVNGNGIVDDGDYIVITRNITINGDTEIVYSF